VAAGGGRPDGEDEAVGEAELESDDGSAAEDPESPEHELTTIARATTTNATGPRTVDHGDRNMGISNL
jgi:hypothetical protein